MPKPSEHFLVDLTGQRHQLHIWPASSSPTAPLLLLLDGDWLNPVIQQTLNSTRLQHVHVASLAYGLSHADTAARRAFDFSPNAPGNEQVDPRVASWQCGGADAFSDFITSSVLGHLRSKLGIEQHKLGLFGHSYGGLYCLYALLTRPTLFDFYYAASPALWWNWPLMPELASQIATGRDPKYLQIMAGENERWHAKAATLGQSRIGGSPTLPLIEQFITKLNEAKQQPADLRLFSSQAHGPMLPLSAQHAIRDFSERTALA